MSVTAKSLSKSGARGKAIDAIIREQVNIIDDRLSRHERMWGRNVVPYDLPTYIPLPGLEKADAQRLVYSSLLRTYRKRGFEVRILISPTVSRLYLAWITDLDAEEVEAMNTLIRSCIISEAEVERFCVAGMTPAPQAVSAVRRGEAPPAPAMRLGAKQVMKPRGGVVGPAPTPPAVARSMVEQAAQGVSSAEIALLAAGQN